MLPDCRLTLKFMRVFTGLGMENDLAIEKAIANLKRRKILSR
ncbi:MAG: hypothetical protein ETSY2_32860 [Candidatus Entotheonella gemina]|uniref:Uncharacterized protein n=1 Tax=Candidatus Entotheonella gemina TaxID=1429439 RepID=W4M1X1_9BACT|nr:MAG: hypothetical protein ETSY2_32860 [Candidatus Entotheonella gemina]